MNNNKHNSMFGKIGQALFALSLAGMMTFVSAVEKVTYYHNDALGSPVAATDESGNKVWREAYHPYGSRIRQENESKGNDIWYTGKPEDKATGLSYFGARWYDPQLGRFMAMDPVGFREGNIHSFNRYAYANGNPYRYVDPDGRAAVVIVPVAEKALEGLAYLAAVWGIYNTVKNSNGDSDSDSDNDTRLGDANRPSRLGASTPATPPNGQNDDENNNSKGGTSEKLSKVQKSKKTENIGDKFTKTTEVRPGKGPGQSRAEYVRYKNKDGKVIRTYKDTYDRAGRFQHRKSLRGGPEGRQ